MINTLQIEEQQNVGYPTPKHYKHSRDIASHNFKNLGLPLISCILALLLITYNLYSYQQIIESNSILTEKLQKIQNETDQKISVLQSNQLEIQTKLSQIEDNLVAYHQNEAKVHDQILLQIKTISQTSNKQKNTLPLDLPYINNKQQSIDQVLYDQEQRKKRILFHTQRVAYVDSKKQFPSLHLAKYNLILTVQEKMAAQADFEAEWRRIQDKFQLSKVATELPMCVIVPGYNNNANFRIQSNLNSIFTQNYSNYRVIVINDASTDGSGQTYRRYLDFNGIEPARYTYIQNTVRVTAVENIYRACTQHCAKEDIVVTVDADDQLLGRNALKVFNWAFQTKKLGVVYSNFYFYNQLFEVKQGFTEDHTAEQKAKNLYRDVKMKFSHLRAYRNELFLKINPDDLKDVDGQYYKILYDQAIFFPLMQMSCGRVAKIEGEHHLLYITGTGLNDYARGDDLGARAQRRVRAAKKYECVRQFDEKMKLLT